MLRTTFSALAFLFSFTAHAANQVYIEANEIGQGLTVKHLNQCYFVAPLHVVDGSVFLTLRGNDAAHTLGDGQLLQGFGYDLAIGSVEGALANRCVTEFSQLGATSAKIEAAHELTVITVNTDGMMSRLAAIPTETGLLYLKIKPIDSARAFYKGMSGSLIFSGDDLIGMLQSVDQTSGQGSVLRIDRLKETIKPFFSSAYVAAPAVEAEAVQPVVNRAIIPFSVTSWNQPSIDHTTSANMVADSNPDSAWITRFNGEPVELEMEFAGKEAIRGMTLVSRSGDKAGIRDYEILVSRRSSGKRGWISILTGTLLPGDTEANISLGNAAAKRIKVRIYSSWDPAGTVTLNELSFY